MAKSPDDLEAVRTLVDTLQAFEPKEQERIIRWSKEKLGLAMTMEGHREEKQISQQQTVVDGEKRRRGSEGPSDIKSFVSEKNPRSDRHFAATVAYYYRFVAAHEQRKDSIRAEDLQEACRQVGRHRLTNPGQTLINAHHGGLLDKGSDPGTYNINTVGENLVAMTLPARSETSQTKKGRKKAKRKKSTKRSSTKKRK